MHVIVIQVEPRLLCIQIKPRLLYVFKSLRFVLLQKKYTKANFKSKGQISEIIKTPNILTYNI